VTILINIYFLLSYHLNMIMMNIVMMMIMSVL